MGQIRQNDFSAGYVPGDDVNNGRPNGLLRMDNLWLDSYGSVSITRFAVQVSVPNAPSGSGAFIYSKFLFNGKNRYVGLETGVLQRAAVGQSFINVLSAGTRHFACGNGFGQVFCTSGLVRKKDDGVVIQNWGINPPAGPPSVFPVEGYAFKWYGSDEAHYTSFTAVEGAISSSASGYVQFTLNATTKRAIIQYAAGVNLSLSNSGPPYANGLNSDTFTITIRIVESNTITSVRVEALFQTPSGSSPDITDYYYNEWSSPDIAFRGGAGQWHTLTCTRGDFARAGKSGLGWESIHAVRVIVNCNSSTGTYAIGIPFQFTGGDLAPLFAGGSSDLPPYKYYQANVYNSGNYIGISPLGPASPPISVQGGTVSFNPYTIGKDDQVNEYWIYKIGGLLQRPYLVAQVAVTPGRGVGHKDNNPDQYYIDNGVTANIFLQSINSIPEEIIGIAGPLAGRMLLLTTTRLYFTDYLNPESYDTRLVIQLSGNVGETNLFVTTSGSGACIVATTADFYQLSGTFQQLPDGTFDFLITPLGVKQPPISESFVCLNSAIFYIAGDGIRELFGSISNVISHNLDVFWRRQYCYDVPGFLIQAGNLTHNMRLGYIPGKLLFGTVHLDNSQSVFEYDLDKKYWYRRVLSVNYFYTEDDGNCLAAFSDGVLRDYDVGSFLDTSSQPVYLQTTLRDGGEPNQRKDLFTFKVIFTGGPISFSLYDENNTIVNLGTYSSTGGIVNIPINSTTINLSKRIGLIISGTPAFFSLKDWSIDYEARPPQECYIRVMPTEFQAAGRKRIATLPIVIDTLNNIVRMQPIIDGVLYPVQNIVTTFKTSFMYQFTNEVKAYDIGYILDAQTGVFEHYGSIPPKLVDILPDLTGFLYIPETDFGAQAKKRIRTIPLVLDTHGLNVLFTPIVDGIVSTATTIFNTNRKTTVYYFFQTDSFGIDYAGILQLETPNTGVMAPSEAGFEFFGYGTPVDVEVLPSPKVYDQLGPVQLDRIGKMLEFRLRVLAQTGSLNYSIFMDDVVLLASSFNTTANVDTVYQIKLPRNMLGRVCRIEISSPNPILPFYRWWAQFRTELSGMPTSNKWITAAGNMSRTLGEGNK